MSPKTNAPTIIKRKKIIVAGGHHGGAWKVAMFNGPLKGALCAGFIRESARFTAG